MGEADLLNLTQWRLIRELTYSARKIDISRKLGIVASHVNYVLRRLSRIFELHGVFDFHKMGLMPVTVISRRKAPPPFYTMLSSELAGHERVWIYIGFPPASFLDQYVRAIDDKPLHVIRGLEFRTWDPLSPFLDFRITVGKSLGHIYVPEEVIYSIDKLRVKGVFAPVRPPSMKDAVTPDLIDAAIIAERMRDPLISPKKAVEKIASTNHRLREIISKKSVYKAVSYHFRKHVLERYWIKNTVFFLPRENDSPIMAAILEGYEHAAVARILALILGTRTVFIDQKRSLIIYQSTPTIQAVLARLIQDYDISGLDLYLNLSPFTGSIEFPIHTYIYEEGGRYMWRPVARTEDSKSLKHPSGKTHR